MASSLTSCLLSFEGMGYYDPSQVQAFSRSEILRVQGVLKGLKLPSSVSIYTTGSAGKLEMPRLEEAPMQLVCVCDDSIRKTTENKVRSLIPYCLLGAEYIEWKDPKEDSLTHIKRDNIFLLSHFLHRIYIIGDLEALNKLLYQFVEEIKKMPGITRQKFRRGFVANHLRQLRHVIEGRDTRSVDLANKIIHYGGTKSQATKYSLLLPIQYVLDLRIIDAIRVLGHWPKDYVSFLKQMPKAIPELIEYMYLEGLLPELDEQDVEDLKNAYRLGLFYFQMGQNLASVEKRAPVKFSAADNDELAKTYANTQRILGKINSGQFCKKRRLLK